MNKTAVFLLGMGAGLLVGGGCGVMVGIFSTEAGMNILTGALESSEPAEVSSPQTLRGRYFTLDYPGNWRVDTDDADYDPDGYFDLNAPGQGKVMIYIVPPESPVEGILAEWEQNLTTNIVSDHERRTFTTWGRFEGTGVELDGRLLVAEGRVRMFGTLGEPRGLAIMEMRYDEDEANNGPGYDLIERTLAPVEAAAGR
ncbi:MAG: hypothetical protein P1V51_02450 [Deltaproteobacteria bacterium]|nr:hypothetical protein [Deltaproteobacteria bacterium]